jgi:hypothetical protein
LRFGAGAIDMLPEKEPEMQTKLKMEIEPNIEPRRNRIWNPKIIKQRCFIREWGRGEGDILFGLAIDRANILYRDLTVYNSKHPKQETF